MIKAAKYTYGGINQDISKSKHQPSYYFEAQHIRIVAEDSQTSGSVTNEKGTQFILNIPTNIQIDTINKKIFYTNNIGLNTINYTNSEINNLTVTNDHKIIGHCSTKNSIILITNSSSLDCVWEIKDIYNSQYEIKLLYIRNLNLSINNPIQLIYNYENEINEKIYWVDGNNQLKFLNLRHSVENGDKENLIDLDSNLIGAVSDIQISQPIVTDLSQGGIHTAGMIQYAYNLYKTNLSQTTLSPFTNLVPLSKSIYANGGNVNETVGTIPIIQINNLDSSYTNIRVYAIKYTSLNEIPSVSIISDRAIPENNSITIYDDGNVISNLSIEKLAFLGSDPIVPKHIESKDNQLFLFNTKEQSYSIKNLDTRAYSFNSLGASVLATSQNPIINGRPSGAFTQVPTNYSIEEVHDCINPNYDIYKYQRDGVKLGGEGKYLKYELTTTTINNGIDQFLKAGEIYRTSIEFYNNKGQKTLPEWIADFIAPDNNLNDKYNTLLVTLKPEFYTFINTLEEDQKPTGYKILRADRTITDRTILCQGIINPMIGNKISANKKTYGEVINTDYQYDQQVVKYPSLIRTFEDLYPMLRNANNAPLANKSLATGFSELAGNFLSEGFKAASEDDWRGQLFQFNNMMQMFTPDVIFGSVNPDKSHKLKIKGIVGESSTQSIVTEIGYIDQIINHQGRINNGISPFDPNAIVIDIIGNGNVPMLDGIFAPPVKDNTANLFQFYREFKGTYQKGINKEYDIYGTPEIQELGQGINSYNNDSDFRYSNNYSTILQDQGKDSQNRDNPTGRGFNSNSISSITFVEGDYNPSISNKNRDRKTIEQLYTESGFTNTNGVIISELVKPVSYIYEGNIYGGNNYESKRRTKYISIGNYRNINVNINVIDSPGDTFVQDFTFTKASKTNITISSSGINQLTEIVSFKVETIIDLKNRNDNSQLEWNLTFQPTYESFQKYNKVYSQKDNLFKRRNVDANFKEVNNFGTSILASKKKIAGEIIDSWTDVLINETLDLDGKYGSINGTINFKDQIYTFQDKAIAAISINPRVQTQGSDGISLELGTGKVLQDYQYITTDSGSINKWGIIAGGKGFYYYDALNKSLFRAPDLINTSLSDVKGLRTWFDKNYDYQAFKIDNPLIKQGVLLGYDKYNKDVYLTFHGKNSKTRTFNEKRDEFVDTKLYYPSIYIETSHKFIGSENNTALYLHNEGVYNNYYGRVADSHITLMINPEPDVDCIFNNIIYKSEVYIDEVDVSDNTLSWIRAYNEYQDSGVTNLVTRVNLDRTFRDWKAFVPRDGRDRIRNPWMFLELGFNNTENQKLVLHDLNVLYTI